MTRDIEVRYTQTNTLVASFTLAVNRKFARQGEQRQADFINVVAWDKTGEFCSKYFKKGQQVAVIGRLQTRHYTDKDSKEVYVTEVIVEEIEPNFIKEQKQDNPFTEQPQQQITDDDLPF